MALSNLQPLPKKHHYKKVDIVVIRTSKTGIIGMSKPCIHCIVKMHTLAPQKGYRINKVYYTNECGVLVDTSLNKLLTEDTHHMSGFYRNTNCKLLVKRLDI